MSTKLSHFAKVLLFSFIIFLTSTGQQQNCGTGCGKTPCPQETLCPGVEKGQPCPSDITLTVWRLFDDSDTMEPLFESYKQKYYQISKTKVTFEYKKMNYDNYENTLVQALAANQGPDIFQIHNDWVPKHNALIEPIPDEIMDIKQYKDMFVDVAASDFIANDNIYAIPFSVDTLALYYNKKILEKNEYYSPPSTWTQLTEYSRKLSKISSGNILSSGVTLGTANNINRASDILYAMMIQNGTNMTSPDNSSASFALPTRTPTGDTFYPGLKSLNFYTSFADPISENFCWNQSMMGSLKAFQDGYAAMTINYSYQEPVIEKFKDPSVEFKVARLPQIYDTDDPISYANYWGESVSRQSKNAAWAWDFIKFVAENGYYNQRTNKPTSLRDNAKQSSDVFDQQSFYAKSFYKIDGNKVDNIFNQMITDVSTNNVDSEQALNKAQNDITDLMIKAKTQ